MNERFKELAEQAGFQYINEEGIGWAGNHNASLPKFAELIARDCIEQLETGKRCDPYTGELFSGSHNDNIDFQIAVLKDYLTDLNKEVDDNKDNE